MSNAVDTTIDSSRQDSGESIKDIQTIGGGQKHNKNVEHTEVFHTKEIKAVADRVIKGPDAGRTTQAGKAAQALPVTQDEPKPTPEEYTRRQEHIRKIVGTLMGTGYGGFVGSLIGGEAFSRTGNFDRQRALKGLITGALLGGTGGYAAGSLISKLKKYTGAKAPHEMAPTIQIMVPPSAQIIQQVEEAIKQGSAVARTAAIFGGLDKFALGMPNVGGGLGGTLPNVGGGGLSMMKGKMPSVNAKKPMAGVIPAVGAMPAANR